MKSSVLFLLLVLSSLAFAQHQHTADPEDARVDLAKLPPPMRIEGLGKAHIAITTKSPEAQQYLIQRGLKSAEMVEHFRLGFANRTLGGEARRTDDAG